MLSPTNGSTPIGSYTQQQDFQPVNPLSPAARAPFGSPISRNNLFSGPQYYSSPCGLSTSSNESPLPMPPVPRFNHPSSPLLRQQQQNQSSPHHRGFFNSYNGSPLPMSPGPRFNTWSQQSNSEPSPSQSSTQPRGFYNSSNESPASMTSEPRFSNTPRNDNFWSQQPHSQQQHQQSQSGSQPMHYYNSSTESSVPLTRVPRFSPDPNMNSFGSPEIPSQTLPPLQQQYQQHQSGSQRRHHNGSSWHDPRRSPGGRGSPRSVPHGNGSPSSGFSGRGVSWSEPRGSSGGRGQAWMNPRGRGGRGLGGSPSPNHGRGSRVHASASERPDLFVKKSMVEDPWKNLVPILMDSLAATGIGNTSTFRSKGSCSDLDNSGSLQPGSSSLKKPKISQIKEDFQSGPSLAESLALAFSDAIREESCS
ncbi:hypothetical protein SUGI_0819360 [Cryptomeria japonica]|nr:hypothetical protein SUGI_0819360 [Cryptomeria japonica]